MGSARRATAQVSCPSVSSTRTDAAGPPRLESVRRDAVFGPFPVDMEQLGTVNGIASCETILRRSSSKAGNIERWPRRPTTRVCVCVAVAGGKQWQRGSVEVMVIYHGRCA